MFWFMFKMILLVVALCVLYVFWRKKMRKKRLKKIEERIEENIEKRKEKMATTTFEEEYVVHQDMKEREKKEFKKKLKINFIISIAISIFLCVYYYKRWDILLIIQTIFVVMIFLCICSLIVKDRSKSREDDRLLEELFFRDICVPCLTNNNYHNVKFSAVSMIPDILIGLMNGDSFEESKIGINCDEFKYSEITYYHEYKYTDKEGYVQTERVVTFKGIELFLACNTNVNAPVRIVPTFMSHGKEKLYSVMSKKRQDGEEHVDIEDIEFNENFEVFSTDPHSAFYFLDANKIEYIKQLRKENTISMVIDKNGLYVAIDRPVSLFNMPEGKDITADDITPERYNNDLRRLEKLFDEFNILLK